MKINLIFATLLCLIFSGCDYEFKKAPEANEKAVTSEVQSNQNESASNDEATNSNLTNNPIESKNSNSKTSKTQTAKLVLNSTAETATIPCEGREVEFEENATANSYTLTGECKKLSVDGVSNKVTVEKVGEISVKGISNKVIYGEGLDGKKPKITKSGTSTSVDSVTAKKKS